MLNLLRRFRLEVKRKVFNNAHRFHVIGAWKSTQSYGEASIWKSFGKHKIAMPLYYKLPLYYNFQICLKRYIYHITENHLDILRYLSLLSRRRWKNC